MLPREVDPEKLWQAIDQIPEASLGVPIPPEDTVEPEVTTSMVTIVKLEGSQLEILDKMRVAIIWPATTDEVRTVMFGPWAQVMALAAPTG